MYKDGIARAKVYVVDYEEVEWQQLTEADIAEYTEKWEEEAKREKCIRLAVRVSPDALFGEGKRYYPVQRDYDYEPYRMYVKIRIILREDADWPRMRAAALNRIRIAYGAKTAYSVYRKGVVDVVEKGEV